MRLLKYYWPIYYRTYCNSIVSIFLISSQYCQCLLFLSFIVIYHDDNDGNTADEFRNTDKWAIYQPKQTENKHVKIKEITFQKPNPDKQQVVLPPSLDIEQASASTFCFIWSSHHH